jgi:hypothetical protein
VMLFEVAMATLIGIAIHLCVEKPLLRKVRLAIRSSPKSSEQIAMEPR